MSTESFAALGVSDVVVRTLAGAGIEQPFAIQQAVIADAIDGRDVIARSPTGSGKTLAFGIPMVERLRAEDRRPSALVLAPTRELATQIVDDIRPVAHARALRVCAVYGGVGLQAQARDAARAHIVVATPGRLEDQLSRGAFTLDHVRVLVLDEADRMLDMGFRPSIDRIVRACPARRQTMLFSATLDGEAGRIAAQYTQDAVTHQHGPDARRANAEIEHHFVSVTHDGRVEALVEHLGAKRELALVFVRTKHGADRLVRRLKAHGIGSVAMHGNRTQRQRERALASFESWEVDVLVATDVAARGIDVQDISHVINFDPPHDSETYVHRVGRAGRAGRSGVSITLLADDQRGDVAKLAGELGIDHGLGPVARGGSRPAGGGQGGGGQGGPGQQRQGREPQGVGRQPQGGARRGQGRQGQARRSQGHEGQPRAAGGQRLGR